MDAKKVKELTKIVNFCRKTGVLRLKMDGLELEMSQAALFPESKYKQAKAESAQELVTTPSYSEEDTLFWSSAGLPEQPGAQ